MVIAQGEWAAAPWNVSLPPGLTGLPKESVANPSQITSLDRVLLVKRAGKLPTAKLESIPFGLDTMLGR